MYRGRKQQVKAGAMCQTLALSRLLAAYIWVVFPESLLSVPIHHSCASVVPGMARAGTGYVGC